MPGKDGGTCFLHILSILNNVLAPRPQILLKSSSPHAFLLASPTFPLTSTPDLQLAPQQIANHLSTSDPSRPPQSREIQRRRESISIPKAQHRRDPASGVLKRETGFVHLVLLDGAAMKMVHAPLRIDLWFIGARRIGELGASQDVKVIISCVSACVAFCANRSTENDQILGDTWILDQLSDAQRSCDLSVLEAQK